MLARAYVDDNAGLDSVEGCELAYDFTKNVRPYEEGRFSFLEGPSAICTTFALQGTLFKTAFVGAPVWIATQEPIAEIADRH